jgi:hypothetical protein
MIDLHIDYSTVSRSQAGAITGVICLKTESAAFPDPSWNDFPVILLGWWFEALSSLRKTKAKTASCRFMDGPFYFDVRRVDSRLAIQCFRQRKPRDILVLEATSEERSFLAGLAAHGEQLLVLCANNGWAAEEINLLRRLKDELAKEMGAARPTLS